MRKYVIIFGAVLINYSALAQVAMESVSMETVREVWFDSIVGIENSGIINGNEYKVAVKGAKSHPFFESIEANGSVVYNHQTYHVPLLYDLFSDVLILKYRSVAGASWFVEFDRDKVEQFELFDHRFKNFDEKGYHDVLVEDSLSLVVRRIKKTYVQEGRLDYDQRNEYFLIDHGMWIKLRGTSTITRLFSNKQDQRSVRDFIRNEHIRVSKLHDEELASLIRFCNRLKAR